MLLLAASLTLSGCDGASATPEASPVAATDTPEPTQPEPTATAVPTELAPLVVLLAPPGSDPVLQTEIEAMVSAEAAARGLRWQLRQTMAPQDIAAEADFLIALPPQPDLNTLAAAAPQTHFLAVGVDGAVEAGNVIVVGNAEGSDVIASFMGGYTGALLTPDARIGIITVQDGLENDRFIAFENGMRFFCGLCRPTVAPFYEYPLFLSLPAEATPAEWRALADFMRDRLVGAVYVTPGTGGEDLVNALSDHGIRIIGGEPPPPGHEASWIASLRMDPLASYRQWVPALLDGETGIAAVVPLELTDVNLELLTAGKLRLAQATLADLLAGYILPGTVE
jgi:hypothetical protein